MIPVHIAFDLEPDERLPVENGGKFCEAPLAFQKTRIWRKKLEEATGAPVKFGWYPRSDSHIAKLCGDPAGILKSIEPYIHDALAAGDEMGSHIHCMDWGPQHAWRANYADENAIDEVIEGAIAAYSDFFGGPPRSARMGDMYSSNRTVAKLESLGVEYDLSVEQGLRPATMESIYPGSGSLGRRPSLIAAPSTPYRPSISNFRKPGKPERQVWIVPLSSYTAREWADPRVLAFSAYSAATTAFKKIRARRVLRPQSEKSIADIDHALTETFEAPKAPNLCVAIRNYERETYIDRFFEALIRTAAARDLRFVTPIELVAITSGAMSPSIQEDKATPGLPPRAITPATNIP